MNSENCRGNPWNYMEKLGWTVGCILEDVDDVERFEAKGKPKLRIKLLRIETLDCEHLNPDGSFTEGHPMAGIFGAGEGIVPFCEWPSGSGNISATSLNCRNWVRVV